MRPRDRIPFTAQAEETVVVIGQPAGIRQRADRGYYSASTSLWGDENRPAVNHHRPVGVGCHPPADGGSGEYHHVRWNIPRGLLQPGGGATGLTPSLRGYHGGDVDNLFLDGMRLMSDGGSHNVVQIDPWFIERVDVIRRPSSALYGRACRAAVNLDLPNARSSVSRATSA